MFKFQTYVLLAFAIMFCTAKQPAKRLTCGAPTKPIVDSDCQKAFKALGSYVKNGRIVHDRAGFQVSCTGCKLSLLTSNHGNLTVESKSVEFEMKHILKDCAGKGSTVQIANASTIVGTNTNTTAILTISFPTVPMSGQGCSII
ncbi:secreted protein [Melampsora americana]|nr:secreted protein [Melampsora americana]